MKNKTRIIKVTGEEIEVFPKNGKDFSLEELRSATGAEFVELVPMRNKNQYLVCDEDGYMKRLPTNESATVYCALDVLIGPRGVLGDVLVCGLNQIE